MCAGRTGDTSIYVQFSGKRKGERKDRYDSYQIRSGRVQQLILKVIIENQFICVEPPFKQPKPKKSERSLGGGSHPRPVWSIPYQL
ncbi:hypothetical protein PAPYR_8606 [Paratrimastix pyriformis]|uniref:Uncharacterized protein n=1 Tax=Paratrimastix pyriformis TaxID=342808 RepID=A0ABQ8UAA7_9EUKA|nr:hypothetical protein PAPYR_8606 [Paratrimastix pyriformis]